MVVLMRLVAVTLAGVMAVSGQALPGKVAFVRGGQLWVLSGGQETRVEVPCDSVQNPRFSGDGRQLAVLCSQGLWVVGQGKVAGSTLGGAVWAPRGAVLAYDTEEGVVLPGGLVKGWHEPAWAPDGRSLAVVRNHGGPDFTGQTEIGLVSPPGGTVQVIWRGAYDKQRWVGPATGLKWSADGKWLAFYRMALSASIGADNNQLNVVPVAGGEAVELGWGPANGDWVAWAPGGATLAFTDGPGRMAYANKVVRVATMPPKPPYQAVRQSQGSADREPAWHPDGVHLNFLRSSGEPPRMDVAAPEQAIWQWDRRSFEQYRVEGSEGALGLNVGPDGRLLWPVREGRTATLWTVLHGKPVKVLERIDLAESYYGQWGWDRVFHWWTGRAASR